MLRTVETVADETAQTTGTEGPRVMLLHPFLMSKEVWEPVVANLATDHQVVAVTLPGHWRGPALPKGEHLTPGLLADYVEDVADELGWDTFHVVGNSLGGWVAYELAKRGRCQSVIAFAPAGGWSRWPPTRFRLILKFLGFGVVGHIGALLAPLLMHSRRLTAAAFKPMAETISEATDAQLRAVYIAAGKCRAYFPLLRYGISGGVVQELNLATCPIDLYLCDNDRVLNPDDFKRYQRDAGDNVAVHHLPGIGHVPMLQVPSEVAHIIRNHVGRVRFPV